MRHSPGLTELIMDAMARSPEARPTVAELFDRFDDLAALAGVGKIRFR